MPAVLSKFAVVFAGKCARYRETYAYYQTAGHKCKLEKKMKEIKRYDSNPKVKGEYVLNPSVIQYAEDFVRPSANHPTVYLA